MQKLLNTSETHTVAHTCAILEEIIQSTKWVMPDNSPAKNYNAQVFFAITWSVQVNVKLYILTGFHLQK